MAVDSVPGNGAGTALFDGRTIWGNIRLDMAGLRCVVTGAASGIGEALARTLVDGGAEVSTLDVRPASIRGARHVRCDLRDPADVERALSELDEGVQVLCNVAGVAGTAEAGTVLRTNFLGPRMLTEGLLDGFADGGSIVNVASTNGVGWAKRLPELRSFLRTRTFDEGLEWYVRESPRCAAYAFSKEALIVYTMTLAERIRDRGIRVNAVSPGATETAMLPELRSALGADRLERVTSVVGRYARPEEIAPTVAFLASAESRWINGQNLVVDGGYVSGSRFRR